MTRLRLRLLATWTVLLGLPPAAFASLHADFGPLALLFMPLLLLKEMAPLALLAAAWLFWKKGHAGWLFACVAAGVVLSLFVRLLVMVGPGSLLGSEILPRLQFVYALMDWLWLVAAISLKKLPPAPAAPAP